MKPQNHARCRCPQNQCIKALLQAAAAFCQFVFAKFKITKPRDRLFAALRLRRQPFNCYCRYPFVCFCAVSTKRTDPPLQRYGFAFQRQNR